VQASRPQRASKTPGLARVDLVAILGLGGLGHLGVQFAAKMGFRTVAVARAPKKASLLASSAPGAYIDSR